MKLTIVTLISLLSLSIIACPGARIELNDDITLTGTGIYSATMNETASPLNLKSAGILLEMADSNGKITHEVMILGSLSDNGNEHDKGGIIFTSYLVKDIKTGKETTLKLNSNYQGNGKRMRSFQPGVQDAKTSKDFSSLKIAGC